jgi:hypothetical protein
LGKDIQDEPGSVNHLALECRFEIPLLRTGEIFVKDDQVNPLFAQFADILRLPAADQGTGIGYGTLLKDTERRLGPCRDRQLGQLF